MNPYPAIADPWVSSVIWIDVIKGVSIVTIGAILLWIGKTIKTKVLLQRIREAKLDKLVKCHEENQFVTLANCKQIHDSMVIQNADLIKEIRGFRQEAKTEAHEQTKRLQALRSGLSILSETLIKICKVYEVDCGKLEDLNNQLDKKNLESLKDI